MASDPKPKRGRAVGSPKKLDGSKQLLIRIDAATLARLDKIAKARKETRSQTIRSLIDLWD